jgi:hypothetical protein
VIGLLLALGAAGAHPFHNSFYGHDVTVTVGAAEVRVDYRADLPTKELWSELRDVERAGKPIDRFAADKSGELLAGLSLTIDGARPVITPIDTEPSEVDERFTRMHVAFSAPLDPGVAHQIALGNANAPEKLAYFRATTHVARAWLVSACSLVESDRSYDGQWRIEEAGRSLTLDVAPRTGLSAWVHRVHADGDRRAAVALGTSTIDELGETWVPVVGFVAILALVGALAARRRAA